MDNLGKVVRFPESEARNQSKPLRAVPNPSAQSEKSVGRFRRRKSDLQYRPQWGPLLAIAAGAVFYTLLAKWFL